MAVAPSWKAVLNLAKEEEAEGVHAKANMSCYAYPVQRQQWGESQLLPHINWGDLVSKWN
jgi:hypothetical protein